jgi:selenocysteine lyase/cysteine desulfurase
MTDWTAVRESFPLVSECTYHNTAAGSPTPPFVVRAAEEYLEETSRRPMAERWHGQTEACRERVADYFGVTASEVLFVANTTDAINTVVNAIDFDPGDDVVLTELNFPSNLYPWLRLERRGVDVTVVPSVEGTVSVDAILSAVTSSTRVVSVPHVSMSTGHRVDIGELGRRLADQDVLLNVDGIQAMGCVEPDLEHVDFYSGAIFKWLLGPHGMGVLYLDEAVVEDLRVPAVGYNSVSMSDAGIGYTLDDEPEFDVRGFELKRGPQRFQHGHVNHLAAHCLSAALDFFEDVGWDEVTDRITTLSGYLYDELVRLDSVSPLIPRSARLGIVTFAPDGSDPARLVDGLAERDVVVSQRGDFVRVSTHLYNDHGDVDDLVEALAAL